MAQEFVEPLVQAPSLRRARPQYAIARLAPAAPVALVLLIAALALLLALRAPPRTLDIGAQGDDRFVAEMLKPEHDPGSGITFRWTAPAARLWLHGAEYGTFGLALHIHNHEAQTGRRKLTIARGERSLGALQLAEGWRIYRVLLPGSAGDAGLDTPPLELATSAVRTPGDSTDRGVPLDWVDVRPLGQAAPPWRALLLTWGLAVLAGWLWQLDRALLADRDFRAAERSAENPERWALRRRPLVTARRVEVESQVRANFVRGPAPGQRRSELLVLQGAL